MSIPSVPTPSTPLTESYTFHSPTPTAPGKYILGVDEAGRGPVLGPLVYGIAYCAFSFKDELEELGFADSKTLSPSERSNLLHDALCSQPDKMGWSVRVICPQSISNGMLKRPPINLNVQSQNATILLIREALEKGLDISEIYVDALGTVDKYQNLLSAQFPGIKITVETKADDKYKIVGAASIAAKVTRDFCVEGWTFEEDGYTPPDGEMGSGYPSDPKTKVWLASALEPTFGFPKIVRFSWTTAKVILEKKGYSTTWIDEGQASLVQSFQSAQGLKKGRCAVAEDLALTSVATL